MTGTDTTQTDQSNSTWATNTTLEAIADWLRDQRAVVLLTHVKPDGDALGSTLAIARALNLASGTSGVTSQAECWYAAPMPGWGQGLATGTKTRVIEPGQAVPGAMDPSAVLVCDTGSWNQLEPFAEWLKARAENTGLLDHHLQGDAEVAPRRVIETQAAAVCEPAAELCRLILGLGSIAELPVEVAEPLYVGLATDTGWFKHSNVTPNVFETAGQLLAAGVDHAKLFELISQRDRAARLKLMARALGNLELHPDKTLAMMSLTPADFKATGAAPGDSGGFVDLPQSVPSIRVVALLTEQEDADGVFTKLSLRSKPTPWDDKPAVDVNVVCNTFGGGGHARASGAKIRGDIAKAKQMLLEALP
ncbi:MAG: phosphoesterase RecJ-like protein [Phycisphaerales bacterium]|jgi:phosphoesterase RecJ-like protein